MPFGAVAAGVGAVAAIGGAYMTSQAAKQASSQQAQSQRNALDYSQGIYGQTQQNLQPWIGGGHQAYGSLLGMYGLPGGNAGGAQQAFHDFQQTPFYQFPLQQGNLALNRQLAASGLTGSGAALKDATAYNQGYASQGLGQYLGGLSNISNLGQQSAAALGGYGNQNAQISGGYNVGIGNAQGAGTMGQNNAWTQGLQGAMPAINQLAGGNTTGPSGGSAYSGISDWLKSMSSQQGANANGNMAGGFT